MLVSEECVISGDKEALGSFMVTFEYILRVYKVDWKKIFTSSDTARGEGF